MEVCTQNFPLICISTGRSSAVAGARGGEKTATLSSPPFLAPDWPGARQSPRTHLWSSSLKGRAVGERKQGQQGQQGQQGPEGARAG